MALRLRPEGFLSVLISCQFQNNFPAPRVKRGAYASSADGYVSGIKRRFRPRGRRQALLPFRAEGTSPLSRTQFVRPEEKGRGHDFRTYLPLPALPDRKATDR
jgi:hypothetical protein